MDMAGGWRMYAICCAPVAAAAPRLASRRLFDVTEQSDAAQCPMLGIEIGLKVNGADVLEVGALRLAINGALVELGILAGGRVDGIDIDDWHLFVQYLHLGLNQLATASVQRGTCN